MENNMEIIRLLGSEGGCCLIKPRHLMPFLCSQYLKAMACLSCSTCFLLAPVCLHHAAKIAR